LRSNNLLNKEDFLIEARRRRIRRVIREKLIEFGIQELDEVEEKKKIMLNLEDEYG
jgi:hypothetical protein